MSVSKNKSQIGVLVPNELKIELEQIARNQDRSLSNLLTIVLKDYVYKQKLKDVFPNSDNPKGTGNETD